MRENRVATCPEAGRIDIITREIGTPAPDNALIRVRACGICGSDLHFYRGEFPPSATFPMGHEIAGEVVEVGAAVSGFSEGDHVAIEPVLVCNRCDYCRTGQRQLCPDRQLLGVAAAGGLAEYVEVPAYTLHHLPADLPFELGALAEPLAVCVHALRLAELQAAATVLVLGAGSIGLLSIVVAREFGASAVAISARHSHQADIARSLGATQVFGTTEDGRKALARLARSRPIDVVVETVGGKADTLGQALGLARPGGRVIVLGVFTGPVTVHPLQIALAELRVIGSMTYGSPGLRSDFEIAIEILARRRNDLAGIISARFALAETQRAFEVAVDKSVGTVKVSVQP